jgi:hypothetical protein
VLGQFPKIAVERSGTRLLSGPRCSDAPVLRRDDVEPTIGGREEIFVNGDGL